MSNTPDSANNPRSEMLGNAPVTSLMIKFAVPSIIAMLVGALYNIVDQLFIGQAVGQLGNAATNIAFPFSTSCLSLALLFGIGGASCFNLSMGRGDRERAPYFVGNAVLMMLICGVVLMAVTQVFLTPLLKLFGSPDEVLPLAQEYVGITAWGFPFMIITTGGGHLIRADGSPRMTMLCNLLGAVINTVLDAVFVLGLDWKMTGAAWATVIGQVISGTVAIVYLTRYKTVHLGLKHLRIRWQYTGKIIAIGMASCINQLAMMIVQIVMNNLLKHYGALSVYGESNPIAVSGIVMKVNQITFSIVIGLGQGAQPIISFNYGARNVARVKKTVGLMFSALSVFILCGCVLAELLPEMVISIFNSEEALLETAVWALRVYLASFWLFGLQMAAQQVFMATGKARQSLFCACLRKLILLIPLIHLMPLFFENKVFAVFLAEPVADLLSVIICMTLFRFTFWRDMAHLEAQADGRA